MKILVIEDEVKIARLIKKVIEMDHNTVDLAHDGKSGVFKAGNNNYDIILLDIMMPEIDGIEICRTLRKRGVKTPIMMLTARDAIADRISAMDAGADDYLAKPFSFEELLARTKALLSGKANENATHQNNVGDANLNLNNSVNEPINEEDGKLAEINKRIMDNAPVSIITIDKEGFMTSANKFYQTLSKRKEMHHHNIFESKFFIRENLVDDYKKLLSDGTGVTRENCYEKNNKGEDKYFKIIAVPLMDKKGRIDGALSMAIDNTEAVLFKNKLQELNDELEKKVMERTAQLHETNKELAKVIDLKSMFVADVSHEMRTSLAIIQGNAELMSRGLIEENEQPETYGQVFGEIKRMSTMLADLALLSNSESYRQNLDYENIDVNKMISSVCKSLRVIADEKSIEIRHENSLALVEVMADPEQLEKLLSNLVRNAIRYNKKNGSIRIWAEEDEKEIVLNVQDTGIGIAQEHLQNVFERFYRVDKARTRSEGGSGLGLAICKWIAEIHGGKIEVSSKIDRGTHFSVRLPRNLEKVKTI